MMRWIWAGMIIISTVTGLFTGNSEAVSQATLTGAKEASELCFSMIGIYALWMGIMQIGEDSGLINSIANIVKKPISLLFKDIKKNSNAIAYITMNLTANMLGMGNAATPFGLKAMAEMQKENPTPEIATHDMCSFIILNTASVQLLPLSIIAVRSAAGSQSAYDIVLPAFIATLATAVIGVVFGKISAAFSRKKCR